MTPKEMRDDKLPTFSVIQGGKPKKKKLKGGACFGEELTSFVKKMRENNGK